MRDQAPPLLPQGMRRELDAEAGFDYVPRFLPQAAADSLLRALREELAFAAREVVVYGRKHAEPRLSAWHAEPGQVYRYAGLSLEPAPFGPALQDVQARLSGALGVRLNSVLANLYRDGRDAMGWHADDEPVFGPDPLIASVSFGAARRFLLRPKGGRTLCEVSLGHGDLLVMWGATQRRYQHAVPRTVRPVGERLNLTFRPYRSSASSP